MSNFFLELLIRMFGDTPWFFKVVRIIGIVVTFITGIPILLESAGIVLPAPIAALASDIIAVASLVGTFVAQLTVTTDTKKQEGLKD